MATQSFQVDVEIPEDRKDAVVKIRKQYDLDPESELLALMVTTEHLMTLFAASSSAGFERALELLCEGARSNRIVMFGGHAQQ